MGATGYYVLNGLPWLEAVLNAAMILTGMRPVDHAAQASGSRAGRDTSFLVVIAKPLTNRF
jgi:hypothetical protein